MSNSNFIKEGRMYGHISYIIIYVHIYIFSYKKFFIEILCQHIGVRNQTDLLIKSDDKLATETDQDLRYH